MDTENLTGPIPISNWIIKDKLLACSYPAKKSPDTIQKWMNTLVQEAGINLFVSLMESKDRDGLLPYEPYLIDILIDYREEGYEQTLYSARYQRELTFVNFPIEDKKVISDKELLAVAEKVQGYLSAGKKVLIHCYGGKGRTGTLMATLLCKYYDFTPETALNRVYTSFAQREKRSRYRMTLTSVQEEQVRRVGVKQD